MAKGARRRGLSYRRRTGGRSCASARAAWGRAERVGATRAAGPRGVREPTDDRARSGRVGGASDFGRFGLWDRVILPAWVHLGGTWRDSLRGGEPPGTLSPSVPVVGGGFGRCDAAAAHGARSVPATGTAQPQSVGLSFSFSPRSAGAYGSQRSEGLIKDCTFRVFSYVIDFT